MDHRTFNTLELDSVLELLGRHVQTPLGRQRVQALRPATDLASIDRGLDLTTECRDYLATEGGFGLSDISDPEEALTQLQIEGVSLDPHQILGLQRLIAAGVDLRAQLNDRELRKRYPRLAVIVFGVPDLRGLLSSIRGKILPTGEIDDNASPELRRIRREINQQRARIYRTLETIMRSQATSIQDEIVTIRNGRFVIPVRTDSRGQVQGVMHGLSSSGQTTYLEPLTVIDQNNELVRLREQEEIEIAQILFSISESLRSNLPGVRQVVEAVAEVDFAQAKARLSLEFNCTRPQMTGSRSLVLRDARHVLLESALRQSGGRIVPVSLKLDDDHQVMVISGPNAGGKTVVLKTAGLIALMAQMGLHVPASSADLPVFEQVFADIGDQQSIAANLSTFTAHMRNISEMAQRVTSRGLILLDEVGTGTDPDEGAALAVAIVDYFRRSGAMTIATTHYNQLKMWVSQSEGVINASVEFDERTLTPTYRLIVGIAGASSGLEIARRTDVARAIVEQAARLLNPAQSQASDYLKRLKSLVDEQEALREALEEERQATAQKYAGLEIEFARREAARRDEFEGQLANVVGEFTAESQRLIEGLQDKATASRLRKEAEARAANLRRSASVRLRKQVTDASTGPNVAIHDVGREGPAEGSTSESRSDAGIAHSGYNVRVLGDTEIIRERDPVLVKALGQEGVVESIAGEVYTVIIGSLRIRAKREELQLLAKTAVAVPKRGAETRLNASAAVDIDRDFSTELNVIGLTADEATDRVDKFLDEASLGGAESVRIIHGHGKGTLRRAISELLTNHPHVASFHLADSRQGGAGATVVELRKM